MMRTPVGMWLVIAVAGAGCSSTGSTASQATLQCGGCTDGWDGPIATHSVLNVFMSWYATCWSGADNGIAITGKEPPDYKQWDCKVPDYTPKIECLGGPCTITPEPQGQAKSDPRRGEHRYTVELVGAGSYQVRMAMDRSSGDDRVETARIEVRRPNGFEATCALSSPPGATIAYRTVKLMLRHDATRLLIGPPQMVLRDGAAACQPGALNDEVNRSEFEFSCAAPGGAEPGPFPVTLVGPDFELTQSIDCTR